MIPYKSGRESFLPNLATSNRAKCNIGTFICSFFHKIQYAFAQYNQSVTFHEINPLTLYRKVRRTASFY